MCPTGIASSALGSPSTPPEKEVTQVGPRGAWLPKKDAPSVLVQSFLEHVMPHPQKLLQGSDLVGSPLRL